MLLKPPGNGTIAYLSYPMSQIRLSRDDRGLCLIVPAYLAVELYRIGILPQDANLPAEISIGGRSKGWYRVSDVRYPERSDSPFGEVTFTLTRVLQGHARGAADELPLSQSPALEGTYVTDITHYLDESGELARMPGPVRKLASFLTLLIEAATGTSSAHYHDSSIRCRTKACRGTILTFLPPNRDEISWHCPACGHNGVIRNWQNTKWNQLKRTEEPE
ncbi:MAG TPA: hypothetical protein VG013_41840 [Gemmataceae bacterium]|nr:hypothetical protein [Gemmataceae bacterium]